MNKHNFRAISLAELLVILLILGMLVVIFLVVIVPKLGGRGRDLDVIQVRDIMDDMSSIQTNKVRKERLANLPECHGYKFYDLAFRHEVLNPETMNRLVSLVSKTDTKADASYLEDDSLVFGSENCSWTAPKSTELLSLISSSGKNRKVVICYNSRNWGNRDLDVLLHMTDGSVAEYYDFEYVDDKYPNTITEEDWKSGQQGTIIGKKSPFDMTFD